jgi:glucose/arabinose dehydrogenase
MDKRFRIAGISAAIIFAIAIWLSPSNPPPIPEPMTKDGNEFVQILATNLEKPWAIDFADDKIFVTEKVGRIRVIESGVLLENPLATLRTANVFDGGLLGIAVHPAFDKNCGTKSFELQNRTTSLMMQKQYLTKYQALHIVMGE